MKDILQNADLEELIRVMNEYVLIVRIWNSNFE